MTENERFYIEVSLTVPVRYRDALCDFITENIAGGLVLQEEDNAETVDVRFYVSQTDDRNFRSRIPEYLNSLASGSGDSIINPVLTEKVIKNIEWEEQYKASVRAVVVAGDVGVRPPWDKAPVEVKYDIVIEPKMAFGTGSHETTRSCLKLIRENFRPGMRFLDLGCGSGILSILADRMKAAYIKAVDYDIEAVENTLENFLINKLSSPYEAVHGSIEVCDGDEPYEFVCANIIKTTIVQMLPRLVELTAPRGVLVLSGLLADDASEIAAKLADLGLDDFRIHDDHEWRSFVVHKG